MAPLQRDDHCTIDDLSLSSASVRSTMSVEATPDIKEVVGNRPLEEPLNKKSVSFAEFSELYVIPRIEYKEGEGFLAEEDYDAIQKENELTLSFMQQGIYPDDAELYFRGLEMGMAQFYHEKKRLVAMTLSAVMEQQKEKGGIDGAWVQNYYSRITNYCALNAYRIGLWDAQAVQAK